MAVGEEAGMPPRKVAKFPIPVPRGEESASTINDNYPGVSAVRRKINTKLQQDQLINKVNFSLIKVKVL